MAKEKPFNNPFGALKAPSKPEAPQTPAPKAPPPKRKEQKVSMADESALFLQAMGAFDPVTPVRKQPPRSAAQAQEHAQQVSEDDTESLIQLAELVIGDAGLEVEETQTSIVAAPNGLDVALIGRLPPAAELDLQPLAADRTRPALERFITDSQVQGLRAVRVVTGPKLRESVIAALTQGRLVRKVLAFRGDPFALDVLLRR